MYEIRCLVGDKKLREVLVFLTTNNTLEPPVIFPVVPTEKAAAAKTTGSVYEDLAKAIFPKRPKASRKQKKPINHGGKHLKGQGSTAVVRDLIERTGVSRISAREMKDATVAAGYSPNAYSHAIKILLADKTIRRLDKNGHYKVVKA